MPRRRRGCARASWGRRRCRGGECNRFAATGGSAPEALPPVAANHGSQVLLDPGGVAHYHSPFRRGAIAGVTFRPPHGFADAARPPVVALTQCPERTRMHSTRPRRFPVALGLL